MNSLLTRLFGSHRKRTRNAAHRPGSSFRPMVEGLEWREVMSSPASIAANFGPALVAQVHQETGQLLQITDIDVTNIAVTGANQITATVNIVGELAGRQFQLNDIVVPINVTTDTSGPCPILHLQLEIEDLNVLGLHVELNNCMEGPVTIDITAIPSDQPGGGLLGDLLCGLSGLLGGQGGLLNLTGSDLDQFTTGLENVLDQVLDGLVAGTVASGGDVIAQQVGGGHRCDLVNLELGAIELNVLGLEVTTSPICLEVYAVQGDGLLGNLLCGLNNLLDNPALPINAIDRILDRIERILDRLND